MVLLLVFIYGLFIGSFLNVVIDRVPKGQSILFPPSHCPHCRHRLAWYDLLPVVSFLLLNGKCRYCKTKISLYYPLLELITGEVFLLVYLFASHAGFLYTLYLLVMASVFIVIFFSDYKYGVIPFSMVGVGLAVSFSYLLYSGSFSNILLHLAAAVGAFVFFFSLFFFTKGRGMGFGDVVLVFLLGLFLGFPSIAVALYISFLIGAIVSVFLIIIGTKKLKNDTIPFGPFLILGTFITLFWGNAILKMVVPYFLFR